MRRIILTASGGPFRDWPLERMRAATPAQAVAHPELVDGRQDLGRFGDADEQGPRADRGASTSSRSAPRRSTIVVHPQSVIHSLVEYVDGSVLAQLGAPDMRVPIAHTPRLARADGDALPAARSGRDRRARLRSAGPGALPGARASPARRWPPAAPSRPSSTPPMRSPSHLSLKAARFPRYRVAGRRGAGPLTTRRRRRRIDEVLEIDREARGVAAALTGKIRA